MSSTVLITKASHHFTVTRFDETAKRIIFEFLKTLVQWTTTRLPSGEMKREPYKTFADVDVNKTTFRFHIEMLDQFIAHLTSRNVGYEETTRPLYQPAKGSFNMSKSFVPRDYQVPLAEYICGEGYKKIITLQTGRGKTAVFLYSVAQMKTRTALVIPPKYFERWIFDMTPLEKSDPMFNLKPGKEIISVQGSAELRSMILLAQSGELTASMLVISAPTYFNYLSDCRDPSMLEKYGGVHPEDLWEHLGVGVLGVDEGHENFHANFKMDLYTNVPKSITLSATLTPDDLFLKRMYQVVYPDRLRMDGGKYVCYADMVAVPYSLDIDKPRLQTAWRGRTDYSQLAYENSILGKKNQQRYKEMLKMIKYDIDDLFLKLRIPEHKLLIFFDTVAMCVQVSKDLAKAYPSLKVGKYTSDEAYEVLDKLDVIVATTKSADTGVDISKLQMCFCFVARGSTTSNLQMFGRLRMLKTDVARPLFLYYYCMDIQAHCNYHIKRKELFADRTVNMSERLTHFTI